MSTVTLIIIVVVAVEGFLLIQTVEETWVQSYVGQTK